jgi:hypothetical protein
LHRQTVDASMTEALLKRSAKNVIQIHPSEEDSAQNDAFFDTAWIY